MSPDDPAPPPPSASPPPPPPPPPVSAAAPPPPPPSPTASSAPAPAPAPAPVDRAVHHGTEQTRTYPCDNCGADLVFDIAKQKLGCPACGNEQDITTAEDPLAENDFHAAIATLRSGAAAREGQQIAGEKEVVCQNCGGRTTFTGSLTSTRCPYCATPIQREDVHEAPDRLTVDGVLPFQVSEKNATGAIDKWINSRWFAPNEFKKYSQKGSFASVYAAYFTYDADAFTSYQGQRGDDYTVTVGSGDNKRTETRTRWRNVSGNVVDQFDDLTVLANDGFDPKHVHELEPWPTTDARPFSAEFIAGHLCRTYDKDVGECFGEAEQRMNETIKATVQKDIGGDKQRIDRLNTDVRDLTYKHLLLPIWLLTVIYAGKPFQVFINGATGEVHGQRPYSKVKIALAVIAAVILVVLAIIAFTAFGSDDSTSAWASLS